MENVDDEFFIRDLTRRLDEQINSVRRELDNLRRIGLLKSRVRNRKKYFYVNKGFILLHDLRNLIVKANSAYDEVSKVVSKLGDVYLLLLGGIFINQAQAKIDMLIVGDVDKKKFDNYIKILSERVGREVRYTIMKKEDYQYRLDYNDKFLLEITSDPANIISINKFNK